MNPTRTRWLRNVNINWVTLHLGVITRNTFFLKDILYNYKKNNQIMYTKLYFFIFISIAHNLHNIHYLLLLKLLDHMPTWNRYVIVISNVLPIHFRVDWHVRVERSIRVHVLINANQSINIQKTKQSNTASRTL